MLDFDVGKLIVIGVVALIVIGPKDLPRVMRQVGNAIGKMRRMANEFQGQFMEAMREADVEDLKKEIEKTAEAAKVDVAFDPVKDIKNQLTSAVEGDVTPGPAASAMSEQPAADSAPGSDAAELDEGPQGAFEDESVEAHATPEAPAPAHPPIDAEPPPAFPPKAAPFPIEAAPSDARPVKKAEAAPATDHSA